MLRGRFLQYMQHVHPDNYNPLYTAQKLKARITAEFEPQLVFWQPQQRFKSELVFPANLDTGEAVEAAITVSSSDEYLLEKAASILHQHVQDSFSSSDSQSSLASYSKFFENCASSTGRQLTILLRLWVKLSVSAVTSVHIIDGV